MCEGIVSWIMFYIFTLQKTNKDFLQIWHKWMHFTYHAYIHKYHAYIESKIYILNAFIITIKIIKNIYSYF